jgi:hypothetical protein
LKIFVSILHSHCKSNTFNPRLTLSATIELDSHSLVHVLVKIKDVLLLALATILVARSAATTTSPVSTATTASSATAATASKVAAF